MNCSTYKLAAGVWFPVALCLSGCGTNGGVVDHPTNAVAPSIVKQPTDQSVPMGLTGTFGVEAVGVGLQYQWNRNGSPIPGATGSTYTTTPTAFSDTGAAFSVIISNASGSVTSSAANLTVTARAPKTGDLRFQQVDALSTIHGYSISPGLDVVQCPIPGGQGYSVAGPVTGTVFFLSNNPCPFQFDTFSLPAGVTGLNTGYLGGTLMQYQDSLIAPTFINIPGPSDSGSVINTISILPAEPAAAFGFIHSDTSFGYIPMRYTVAGSGLQAFATQEGLKGRVITAVSYDGTNAAVFSYGWTDDPSTTYEASVVFATLDTTATAIQQMAAEGYIITATSCSHAADGSGVVIVGTKVQGDTMLRPVLVGDVFAGTVDPVLTEGYAIVAVVQKYQNNALVLKKYIGER